MAKGKKSFVLYSDQRGLFDKLDNEQAGKLIKHIFSYVNDENPEADFITELAFESIKTQLKRDLEKWESQLEQRREAGKKSAEVRKRNKAIVNERSTSVNERLISSTDNVNVNVNVNDNVSVNDINKDLIDFDYLLSFIKKKTNRNFKKINDSVKKKYKARIKEGYTLDDIEIAVKNAVKKDNHIKNNYQYLTPEFFSRADKLDLYGTIKTKVKSNTKENRDPNLIYYQWKNDPSTMVRTIHKDKAQSYFNNQANGGYYPKYL